MINVLIVEDSRVSRNAFQREISGMAGYKVIAAIENAANAELICLQNKVDLILMDICTADDESGLEAAGKIKEDFPEIRIIMMTSMPEYTFISKARESGCDSFWYKETDNISLSEIIQRTMTDDFVWPDETPNIKIGCADSRDFTKRELQVIRDLAAGKKYSEIADHLQLSENTVKYHVKNILQKTGFRNTLSLVVEVVEKKYILPKY